ncbi:MAG TPA: methyltransferase [Abditibacterium sp.]
MSPPHYFSSQTSLLDAAALRGSPSLPCTARGKTLQFLSGAGVFSKNSLDEGSQLLIEELNLQSGAKFCDLGCGWGAVGAFVAADFPQAQVFAVDVNPRAAQLTKRNYELNRIENAVAWCGDGLSAVPDDFFDAVACNPPIRAGNAVIEKLFDDAYRTLKVGGALWVVIRTAQGAKSWQKKLAVQFGSCELVEMRAGYRVMKSIKAGQK